MDANQGQKLLADARDEALHQVTLSTGRVDELELECSELRAQMQAMSQETAILKGRLQQREQQNQTKKVNQQNLQSEGEQVSHP